MLVLSSGYVTLENIKREYYSSYFELYERLLACTSGGHMTLVYTDFDSLCNGNLNYL